MESQELCFGGYNVNLFLMGQESDYVGIVEKCKGNIVYCGKKFLKCGAVGL